MSLSPQERAAMVQLARQAVEAEVCGRVPPRLEAPTGILAEWRGCFVTLTNAGRLRGCIGTFQPAAPLAETLVEMGRAAAHDPRFVYDAITPGELKAIHVEVSVLSPLQETDAPERLTIGTHGIYIVAHGRSGCFLPEVATDLGFTAEQFLDCCCAEKAHLPAGAWRQPGTKVYLFTSEKFGQ
jgi:uncharacterized protein